MIGQFIEVVSDGDKYMKRFITKRTFVDFYFFSILYLLPCLLSCYTVHIFFALLAEAGGGRDTRRLRATTVRYVARHTMGHIRAACRLSVISRSKLKVLRIQYDT